MNCRSCGSELREGTRFCGKCGAAVEIAPVTRQGADRNAAVRTSAAKTGSKAGGMSNLLAAAIAFVAVLILGGGALLFLSRDGGLPG
ncbi:MAG: zinc-ribbon domain-containing protein [Chloroflexota bacterium]|jgi:uncharacterized membrane protein YvbJ